MRQAPRRSITPDEGGVGRVVALTLGAVALVAATGFGFLWYSPAAQQWVFDRAARKLSAPTDTTFLAGDAMRVIIAGSSAPLPSARRAKACVAVFAGGKFYLVDVGPESVETLLLANLPLDRVGGVLLTHFHSDHIGDLGEFNLQTWVQGRPGPLAVYGGPGVDRVVDGFNLAYTQDQGYRTAHHTARIMPPETWPMVAHTVELDGEASEALDRTGLVLEDGDLRITAIEVAHPPITPAYAYRFDYKGRSAVVTGDLKSHPPLAVAAQDADLMVSEAIARPMVEALERAARASGRERVATIMHDVQDYHIDPAEAARLANGAGVKHLAFYHLLPAPDGLLPRRMFAQGIDGVRRGGWTLAEDGSVYELPIGSDDVRIGRLRR